MSSPAWRPIDWLLCRNQASLSVLLFQNGGPLSVRLSSKVAFLCTSCTIKSTRHITRAVTGPLRSLAGESLHLDRRVTLASLQEAFSTLLRAFPLRYIYPRTLSFASLQPVEAEETTALLAFEYAPTRDPRVLDSIQSSAHTAEAPMGRINLFQSQGRT